MKKLLFLSACLLALSGSPVQAQVANPDMVVVRVCEAYGSVEMVISHGEGKSEYLKFDNGASKKNLVAAAEGYHRELVKLYQQGYTLQSTFTAALNPGIDATTLLFVKVPKP